jgi:hypothetical protein
MRQLSVIAGVLALVAVIIAALVCMMSPLLSNPGPEAASILGIVGGLSLGIAQAARAAQKSERGAFDDAIGGLVLSLIAIGIFIAATAIGGALRPTCGPERGYLPFLLLSAPVLALQVAVGTFIGRLVRRPGRAVLAFVAFELIIVAWLFLDWVQAPSFRVASHMFVVVAGDLLRGAEMTPTVIAFRFGTLCFAGALLAFSTARYPRIRRAGLNTQALSGPTVYAIAGVLAVCGIVAHAQTRDELAPTKTQLDAAYSLVKTRGPLVVHADPEALRPRDVDALLAEGTLWIERLKPRLGVSLEGDIHIYAHASAEARGHWTGASHVDFALPWHREIHLGGFSIPHRSLGHELAHILAGELSDSLLRVPGRLVVMHNAAIVEGVAVAATPELAVADGLTTRELAAAMKRAGRAPDVRRLFSATGFFTEAPTRAYTAAGAVVESLTASALPDPTAAIRTLYATGSLEQAAGGPEALDRLISEHEVMLDALELPPDAAIVAEARFRRPSILEETCDPDENARADEIRKLSRTGQTREALARADALGEVSAATLEDLYVDAAYNRDGDGLIAVAARLAAVEDLEAAEHQEAYADALWRRGRVREATATWARTSVEHRPLEAQRTLLAKKILGEGVTERADKAVIARAALDVLVKTEARQSAFFALAHAIGASQDESPLVRSLGSYILARRLIQLGAVQDGAPLMRRVLDDALLPPMFLEQAALTLGTGLLRSGQAYAAQRLLFDAATRADRPAMRILLKDRAERAQRAVNAPEAPEVSTPNTDPAWADRLLLGADDGGDLQ